MPEFKEMLITPPRVGILPSLNLQGRWLDDLGFCVGSSVNVVFRDSCLTLSTNPITSNNSSMLQVSSKLIRNQPQTHLALDWWLLRKYGFHVYDKVVLQLMPNTIQITKINFYTTARCT